MNKKEAAKFLGGNKPLSTRTIERYISQGILTPTYIRGKTRDVADFDEEELRKLKERMEQPREPVGHPAIAQRSNSAIATNNDKRASEFVGLLAEALSNARPVVPIADKLILSLVEAAQLAGLSKDFLSSAIQQKKLKAKILGRGWKIKRPDLELFVKKL